MPEIPEFPETLENPGLWQHEKKVPTTPIINGTNCSVIVNVAAIFETMCTGWGLAFAASRSSTPFAPPPPLITDKMIESAIITDLNAQMGKCAAGSICKVQFLYHSDSKLVPIVPANPTKKTPDSRNWEPQDTMCDVLNFIQKSGINTIQKIVLSSCSSAYQARVVFSAFNIQSVKFVITADQTIELTPGKIRGADYEKYGTPKATKIIIWQRGNGKEQIAQVPDKPSEKDEEYDIPSGTIKKR